MVLLNYILLVLLEGFSHVSSFQVIILSAKLGLCSSSIHPIHCCPNGKQPVRGILHVPSWTITLLSQRLGIKAAICFCISDKHLSICPYIHCSVPCVCLSFASWAPLHTCSILTVQMLSVTPGCMTVGGGLGESTKSSIHKALCSRALSGRFV